MHMNRLLQMATYISLTFSFLTHASCPEFLDQKEPLNLEQVEREFAEFSRNYEDGIGIRGFMGSQIPNKTETVELALKHGIMWWGLRMALMPTLEEAVEHRLKIRAYHEAEKSTFTDIIIAPLYILGNDDELAVNFSAENPDRVEVPEERMRALLSRGAYEIDYLGNARFITPEKLLSRLNPNEFNYWRSGHMPDLFGKNTISQHGWVALKQHGIHDYSQWKNTEKAKRLRKKAIRLLEQGYTIRFNFDHEAAMNKLREQERTFAVASEDGNGKVRKVQGQALNRYDNKELFASALAKLKAGKGYSIGVYNEKNQLVAGEIGFRIGNHVYGDSVFYSDDIEIAKVAALALMEYFDSKGMPYTDPGMVTRYTASMGGELIPFPEYLAKMQSGPKELIEFPTQWDPRTPEMIEKTFGDIARRRSQGIGNIGAITRWPVNRGPEEGVAARAGVVPKLLVVKVVRYLSEASLDASIKTKPEEIPLYIVIPQGIEISAIDSLTNVLNRVNEAGKEWQVVQIKHPKFSDHVVQLDKKRFLELLSLDRESESLLILDHLLLLPVWSVK